MKIKFIFGSISIFILYSISFVSASNAQQKTDYFFFRIGRKLVKNVLLTNERMTADEFSFGYRFASQSIQRRSGFEIVVNRSEPEINKAKLNISGICLSIYDGFNLVKDTRSKTMLYLGYALQANPMFAYSDTKNIDRFSWRSVNSFSIYHAALYKIRSGTILFEARIPLVACIYRPDKPYNSDRGGKFNEILTSVYKNPAPATIVQYRAIELSANYSFVFKKTVEIRPGLSYSNEKYSGITGFEEQSLKLHLYIGL